ncbi:MAG: FAD-dependent oxidoreductase, partial [Nitrososphaerota archaeon]|nr:FAD-dependent oxidoreductase [Nitrososphaerota archaeon]
VVNTEIGKQIQAKKLLEEFDATLLCGGATVPRNLPIEGRNLRGIHFGVEYLTESTKNVLNSNHKGESRISARDKHVIVMGGGDTGTDCVGTAMRQNCKSLVQFEILPRPPDQRAPDNPWPQYPRVYKLDYGQEEAKDVFGSDPRVYSINTTKFMGDQDGNIQKLATVDVEWKLGQNGRFSPNPITGTERIWSADLVLLALGFLGPEDLVLKELGVERDQYSNAKAEEGRYSTNVPGVFAAGDMRRGQSLVVWAFKEGREAAREVDRYLMGSSDLP